jgi:RimJ/RimL family protein N-acetyltransferase
MLDPHEPPGRPARLPDHLEGPQGLLLRRWNVADAETLATAVAQSTEHLRPWMGWVSQEPMTLAQRRAWLAAREREWTAGGDVVLGVFVDGEAAGGCGLHRRIASDGLEIGYWIHPAFTGRGIGTAAARLLTDSALALPEISHVEIHHDKANLASGAIPRRLGYRLVGESRDAVQAPAETGIECTWRMDRELWASAYN